MKRQKTIRMSVLALLMFAVMLASQAVSVFAYSTTHSLEAINSVDLTLEQSSFIASKITSIKTDGDLGCSMTSRSFEGEASFTKSVFIKKGNGSESGKIDGSAVITYKNAAKDADGNTYDVKMTISNVRIAANNLTEDEDRIVFGADSQTSYVMASYAKTRMDVHVEIVGASKNDIVIYQFTDFDVGGADKGLTFTDPDDMTTSMYDEGVTLNSGIKGKVWKGNKAQKDSTGTRFWGTGPYNQEGDHDKETGIIFNAYASGFDYTWWGNTCGTWLFADLPDVTLKITYKAVIKYLEKGTDKVLAEEYSKSGLDNGKSDSVPSPKPDGYKLVKSSDSTVNYTINGKNFSYTVYYEKSNVNVKYAWKGDYPSGQTPPASQEVAYGGSHKVDTTFKKDETKVGYNATKSTATYNGKRGYWVFNGWDKSGTVSNITEDLTIYGTWKFVPNVTVDYAWVGDHPNKTVPGGGEFTKGYSYPVDTTYKVGDKVWETNVTYKNVNYKRGYWDFKGWDKSGTITLNEDTHIKGTWGFTPYWNITTEVVNGTINPEAPNGHQNIPHGENRTVSYAPTPGYLLSEIIVDGQNENINNNPKQHPFNKVGADHHIKVVYEKQGDPVKVVKDAAGNNIHQKIVNKGATLYYEVTVTNPTKVAKTYRITDRVPANTQLVANSIDIVDKAGNDNCGESGGVVTWNVTIPANQPKTVKFAVTTTADGVQIDNKANMYIKDINDVEYDKNTNTVTNWTPIPPTKSVFDPDMENTHKLVRLADDVLTYRIDIQNPATINKTFTVTDKLPAGVALVDNGGASVNGDTLTWTFTLGDKEPKQLQFKVRILPEAKDTVLDNKASFTVDLADKPETNNTEVPVLRDPVKDVIRDGQSIDGMLVNMHGFHDYQDNELDREVESILTYTINVKNPARDAKTFTVKDVLEETIDLLDFADSEGVYKTSTRELLWVLNMAPGEERTLTFRATPNAKNIYIPNYANAAVDKVDKDTNTVENWVPRQPEKLVYDEKGNPIPYHELRVKDNRQLYYIITYANNSSLEKEFTITDPLPPGVKFLGSDKECEFNEETNTVVWHETMRPNSESQVRVDFTLTEDFINAEDPSTVRNVAYVEADLWDDYEGEINTIDVPVEIEIPVQKVWYDKEDQLLKRPDSINVMLHADGSDAVLQSIKLSAANDWRGTFRLSGGEEIKARTYTVSESTVPGYKMTFTGNAEDGFVIENELIDNKPVKDVRSASNVSINKKTVADGETLVYVLSWKNNYDEEKIVRFYDAAPEGTTLQQILDGGVLNESNGEITWKKTAGPGATVEVRFEVKVNERNKKIIENTGVVEVDGKTETTNKVENYPQVEAIKAVYDEEGADINGKAVRVGDILTYKVTVKNKSEEDAIVTITDTVPDETEFVSAEDGGTEADRVVTWSDVFVEAHGSTTVSFKVKVTTDEEDIIRNVAIVTPEKGDEVPTNEVENPVIPPVMEDPTKAVKNADGEDINTKEVAFGDILTYEITFKNPSKKTQNFTVTDKVPVGVEFVSAENGGTEDEGTVTWNLDVEGEKEATVKFDVKVLRGAPDIIVNKATVLMNRPLVTPDDEPELPKDTNEVTNTTPSQEPEEEEVILGDNVTVYKIADPVTNTKVDTDDTITYSFKAKNTGEQVSGYTRLRDYIPSGTEFVEDSIQGNGVYVEATEDSKAYVEFVFSGIEPNKWYDGDLSFAVKVTNKAVGVIKNVGLFETTEEEVEPGSAKEDPNLPTNETQHPTDETPAEPVIEVVKDSNPTPGTKVKNGDTIEYKLTIKNTGAQTANSIVVRDPIPARTEYIDKTASNDGTYNKVFGFVQFVIDTLEPGDKMDVTFKVRVLNDFDGNIVIKNQAKYDRDFDPEETRDPKNTSNIVEHPAENITPPIPQGWYVTVYKNSDPKPNTLVEPGQEIKYILTAKNTGAETSKFTIVRDEIPFGTTYVEGSASEGGVYVEKEGEAAYVEWVISGIEPNKTYEGDLSFKVKVNDSVSGLIRNTAKFANKEEDPGEPGETGDEPFLPTNTVTHRTDDDPVGPFVEVIKDSDPAPGSIVKSGDVINYTLTVKNSGDKDATHILVRDYIPQFTEYVDSDGKLSTKLNAVQWVIDKLEPDKETTLHFSVRVTTDATSGVIDNQALYQNEGDENDPRDPEASTNIVSHPFKVVPEEPIIGEKVTVYKYSNPKPNSLVKPGDKITYSFKAKNTGKDVSGYTVIRDEIPVGTTFVEGSIKGDGAYVEKDGTAYVEFIISGIEPNAEYNGKLSFDVKVNDSVTGIIKNYGVFGTVPEDPGKPGETETVITETTDPIYHTTDKDMPTPPVVEVIKTSKPEPGAVVKQGDEIEYTLTIMNTGGSDANKVVVRDNIPDGMTYVGDSATNGGVYNKVFNRVQWYIPTLKAGEQAVVTFKAAVAVDRIEPVKNQAVYAPNFEPDDPNTPKNSSNIVEHPVEPVVKDPARPIKRVLDENGDDINKGIVKVGDILTYEISVINGEDKEQTMVVKDKVPTGTKFVSAYGQSPFESYSVDENGTHKDGLVTWTLTMPANGRTKVYMKVEVTSEKGKITNVATVTDEKGNEVPTNEVENTPKEEPAPTPDPEKTPEPTKTPDKQKDPTPTPTPGKQATPTPTPAPTQTPIPTVVTTPISNGAKTGDIPVAWFALVAIAGIATVIYVTRKRKKA